MSWPWLPLKLCQLLQLKQLARPSRPFRTVPACDGGRGLQNIWHAGTGTPCVGYHRYSHLNVLHIIFMERLAAVQGTRLHKWFLEFVCVCLCIGWLHGLAGVGPIAACCGANLVSLSGNGCRERCAARSRDCCSGCQGLCSRGSCVCWLHLHTSNSCHVHKEMPK